MSGGYYDSGYIQPLDLFSEGLCPTELGRHRIDRAPAATGGVRHFSHAFRA